MARALSEAELLGLVDALAGGQWCSGEALAAAAGVTRAALAKRMAHLREWGLQVEAEAGRGYRLAQPLQRLDQAAIRRALPPPAQARLGVLAVVPRTDSTNQRLLDAVAANDPQALFAEAQTQGRGRRGRQWRSPFGANLYFSLSWTFAAWPPQLPALSLAAGVACARALRRSGAEAVRLKWPNDLRVGAAKLGGILIEQRGEAGGNCRVVIGVGINVSMSAEQAGALDQPWTSLQAVLGEVPDRNLVAAHLLDELLAALAQFEVGGFEGFLERWNALDATAGQAVRIEGGAEPLQGIARGVDEQGCLIVEAQGRRHRIHAGEVSLRAPEPAA